MTSKKKNSVILIGLLAVAVLGFFAFELFFASQACTANCQYGDLHGDISVGPAQPTCQPGVYCGVDLSSYSIVFTLNCNSFSCPTYKASLSVMGNYSLSVPSGSYKATGISPSCPWLGCGAAFSNPSTILVSGNQTTEFDLSIDTGIR